MNGLHLDLKWSMFRKEYLEDYIIRASKLGIDTILFEPENKLMIDFLEQAIHPEHWETDDLKWFLALAQKYKITVIPKIPLLGHMEWILQCSNWSHLRENGDRKEICPNHPETPGFVQKVLDIFIDLFKDSPIIHLGGDEAGSLGTCERCRESGKSKSDIFLGHYLPLIQSVERAGKRVMIYCDMILGHPDIINKIPRSVIIADWDYWSGTDEERYFWGMLSNVTDPSSITKQPKDYEIYKKNLLNSEGGFIDYPYAAFLKDQGFDVVTLSAARSGGDNYCVPRTLTHVTNALAAAKRAHELDLMGTIVTSWACRFNHPELSWPSIVASSMAYQNPKVTISEVATKYSKSFLGFKCESVLSTMDRLSWTLPDSNASPHIIDMYADPYPPNIVHKYIKRLYQNEDSMHCNYVRENIDVIKKDYASALRSFQSYLDRLDGNKTHFDHWLLAAETLVHKSETVQSVIAISQGKNISNSKRKKNMLKTAELKSKYEKLFSKSLLPISVQMEIDLRFAEEYELLQVELV